MQWLNILAVLACPLMMLFCMKGMFTGHKEAAKKSDQVSPSELQSLQIKMVDLMEQNHKLNKELEAVKEAQQSESRLKDTSVHAIN